MEPRTASPNGKRSRSVIILTNSIDEGEAELFGRGSEGQFLIKLGSLLATGSGGRLLVCSVLIVPEEESVSAYSTTAQTLRQELEQGALSALSELQGEYPRTALAPIVKVAYQDDISNEVRRLLETEPSALLLLPWKPMGSAKFAWLRKALRKPLPCDVAWARPTEGSRESGIGNRLLTPDSRFPIPTAKSSILVPARGGPQAELSLELAQDLMESMRAEVTVLHIVQNLPEKARATEEAPFAEFLTSMSKGRKQGVPLRTMDMERDPIAAISQTASDYDLLIMGAGNEPATDIGKFTQRVAENARSAVIAVKSRVPVGPAIRAARRRARPHALDSETLSRIVDKWFAENTFHAEEFSDLSRLIEMKRQQGLTISLGLPALNEEETIGNVIKVLKRQLMVDAPLLDEIALIDSNSTDRTREIATKMGIPVYIHQQALPEAGTPVEGKGEALWKSLHLLKGDIIAWVDTDVANMHPQFVYGLVGPLLREPRIGYVKGYYHRPIQTGDDLQHEGGGRVTELTVRPLFNLFFPLLSGLVQPLAGEYAGRREVLEQLPFFSGYGVETGLLIDLLERYGLSSIGQVNLEKRVHRNRSLADLSLTAFAIVQVILTRLEERARNGRHGDLKGGHGNPPLLEEVNQSMKLIRFEEDHLSLVVRHVRDIERPPIATIPAYRMEHPTK